MAHILLEFLKYCNHCKMEGRICIERINGVSIHHHGIFCQPQPKKDGQEIKHFIHQLITSHQQLLQASSTLQCL